MTKTTVYFWGGLDATGHVSILVEDRYFSFHPDGKSLIDEIKGKKGRIGGYAVYSGVSDPHIPEL
jgi:hypothetical protein